MKKKKNSLIKIFVKSFLPYYYWQKTLAHFLNKLLIISINSSTISNCFLSYYLYIPSIAKLRTGIIVLLYSRGTSFIRVFRQVAYTSRNSALDSITFWIIVFAMDCTWSSPSLDITFERERMALPELGVSKNEKGQYYFCNIDDKRGLK